MRAGLPGTAVVLALLLTLVFTLVPAPAARAQTVATLEWPPYSGADLPDMGTSIATIRSAFEAAGMAVEFAVLPWQRAIRAGLAEEGYIGYGPEYYDTALDVEAGGDRCLFSRAYGTGPLGFVEAAGAPIAWSSLADLESLTIGTVAGYLNEPAFDAAVATGRLTVEEAPDDTINIRKVAGGRIDAAVIDSNVLRHLLATDDQLAPLAGAVRMNDRLLADKTLHLCFRPDDTGRAARDRFHAGLDRLGIVE